jgi:hypothetical protein
MDRKRTFVLASVFAALVALTSDAFAQARGNLPAPTPAKMRLSEATAAAKKWKPDAILLQIGGGRVGAEGLLPYWDYGFYSATAKTCAVIQIIPNVPPNIEESGGPTCAGPELKEFMDSEQAMKIARSNGITAPLATMYVSVSSSGRGTAAKAVWSVMDGGGVKAGDVLLDIDGVSGAILSKTTQR